MIDKMRSMMRSMTLKDELIESLGDWKERVSDAEEKRHELERNP